MRTPTRNSIRYRLIAVVLLVVILPAAVMAQGNPNCCIGRVGDASGVGGDEPTIADVSVMIGAKFIAPWECEYAIPCLQEADINQSGGTDPSCADITIGDISFLIDYLFITGPSLGLPDCLEPSSDPYGYVVDRTDCITGAPPEVNQAASSASCLWYEYDGVGTLDITHQNAVLNCCPMPTLSVEIEGDTITITEADEGLCDCYCLYDIDYRLVNLPPGEYRIIVHEAYPAGGDPLDFTVDLVQNPTGLLCVERTGYPWGGSEPALEVIGNSGCLSQGAATSAEVNDQTCVSYEYNEFGTLSILHGLAGFNCCPSELGASFSIDGNTITITEYEVLDQGGCSCLCLFDLEYWITNLPPGVYNIVIEEPHLPSGDQPLEFTVDLTSPTEGTHCEARSDYPWGYVSGIEGRLIDHTDCKSSGGAALSDPIPNDQGCIEYEYDGTGTLLLTHVNAGFNCCPTYLAADFDFDGNIITVTEIENLDDGACKCLCLFDLEYEIVNLLPGEYRVVVIEPYVNPDEQQIDFTIDLIAEPSGTFCVERTNYPWGQ